MALLKGSTWWRRPGDSKTSARTMSIVITLLEHHANIVPWQQLAAEKGARLRVVPVDDSGHKVFAPTGIGVLYGKEALLNEMPPWQHGGNMITDVTFERSLFQQAPGRFEAGTGNIADAVGLGAAIDYVKAVGLNRIAEYERQLVLYATRLPKEIPGLRLIGSAPEKAGVISFVIEGQRTEDVRSALNREGIAVRSGHHCAQPVLRRFGVESSVHPSFALYNTCADIDALIADLTRLTNNRTQF